MGSTWVALTIVAGLAFMVAIGWAMSHNRGTPEEEAATEAATHRMYDEQARDDGMIEIGAPAVRF